MKGWGHGYLGNRKSDVSYLKAQMLDRIVAVANDRCWRVHLRAIINPYSIAVSLVLLTMTAHAQDARSRVDDDSFVSVDLPTSNANSSTTGSSASNNATNESNDPTTPKRQLQVQNYFMPKPEGYGGRSVDEEFLRLYLPFKMLGIQNIFRVYQPLFVAPVLPRGWDVGLGDTTVYDMALHRIGGGTFGTGPLLIAPVATHANLGHGKWEIGGAGIAVLTRNWGLLGTVVTYSHSFSGYGASRPADEQVTVQPLIHYNLGAGWYLRSSGFWNLDYSTHVDAIPVGFGAGKVRRLRGGTVINLYLEPQYSVYQNGTGSPKWQLLSAITFQFPNSRRTE